MVTFSFFFYSSSGSLKVFELQHEAGNKAAEKIKNQLDKLSPGEENLKATKDVREETDKLKQLLETNSLSDEKDDGTENDDRNEKMRYDGGHLRKEY